MSSRRTEDPDGSPEGPSSIINGAKERRVNFGDILEKWEKRSTKSVYDKDLVYDREESSGRTSGRGERRSRLLRKTPDASIDLHGLTGDEAWTALESFFENSRSKGCEKLLIIHGKGSHHISGNPHQSEGVLRELSRRFIEVCSFAGESGYSSAREGGTGATWVILKE